MKKWTEAQQGLFSNSVDPTEGLQRREWAMDVTDFQDTLCQGRPHTRQGLERGGVCRVDVDRLAEEDVLRAGLGGGGGEIVGTRCGGGTGQREEEKTKNPSP